VTRKPNWTPPEKSHLTRFYPKLGPDKMSDWFQKHGYDRTPDACRKKANELGVKYGIPRGYLSIYEVTEMYSGTGDTIGTYIMLEKWAEREGVLFKVESETGRKCRSVPEEWAFKKLDAITERREYEAKGWWTVKELSPYIGEPVYTIHNVMVRKAWRKDLREKLSQVEKVRGLRNRWLFNPESVMEVFHGVERAG